MHLIRSVTKRKLSKVDTIAKVNATAGFSSAVIETLQDNKPYNWQFTMEQCIVDRLGGRCCHFRDETCSPMAEPRDNLLVKSRTTHRFITMDSPSVNVPQRERVRNQQRRIRTRWRSSLALNYYYYYLIHSVCVWLALWGAVLGSPGLVGAAAVVHDQENKANLDVVTQMGDSPLQDESTIGLTKTLAHFYEVKLPSPISGISGVPVSPSTAHVHWFVGRSSSSSPSSPFDSTTALLSMGQNQPPTTVGSTGQPVQVTAETELASRSVRLLAYYIERDQRPARLTLAEELFEDGLRPSASCNVTVCVRRLQVAQILASTDSNGPRLPLLSVPLCATGLRGLPLAFVKPLYIAFVEIVAMSLVVSVITCIFVHYALERLKAHLRGPSLRHSRDGGTDDLWMGSTGEYKGGTASNRRTKYDKKNVTGDEDLRSLRSNRQLPAAEHDDELVEPDERSRIITGSGSSGCSGDDHRAPLSSPASCSSTSGSGGHRSGSGGVSTSV